ncbi:acyl-CoA dehydrogenase family protein [Nocardia cyriacigeorgica]|uniref:acyl-CoA dehydrogenase family protein n=1 Tax=Nocardia cyriacigeorgica TaxID=135487 RepID=UPI0013D142BF|nr:acyl-CoA dehydrogenase family protein [Nocardia cyriacigeorgica]MBF6436905.1 acyl-CoA/acyl-ACP dehydrogenase [Nocardia cyriacigeorgica]MBF6452472.1 acyl-CoA/acyl-ACP dehydrogenase [Nocardia cyriacigeorgica]MBF6480482.1 acyl-CoA/acyl-ACP dehydrogenase [Nocardia cyriacigeorgica]MBF6549641.1 acyl-CoA/acyl-ACP dehydrogenase [Nocardia cyriacigeorgica]NEW26282.1 acyl-CoA/acyl-ACP dehydrogenase [Nocardia cyriacigeorgica]
MYQWSDEDLMFRDAVRGFIDKELKPHVDQLESGAMPPYDIIRKLYATFGLDEMAREGLAKSLAREEAGTTGKPGGGFSGAGSMGVILNSELAGVSLGLVASMGVSLGLAVGTIRSRGTLAQKKRWLPELVTMEKVGAWAITEPDSGSDAFGGMKSYVRRDGEDYILNGQKTFITNGPYADVTVVYAKLDEQDGTDRRDRKVLTFVLDKGMPGFTQSPPFKKMGMNSSPTGELFFDNVRITPDRLLGETENPAKGDGKDSAKESFAAERIGIASLALGIINECHRLCVEYAKSRKLWGREIAQFQLIQLKLAEMEIARINVQNMVFNAIERTAAGEKVSLAEASAMKLYSSRAATEVAMEAVQLFGGNGYMAEYKVEQLARDAKSLMIYAGSNEIQVTHIAKGLVGG